MPDQAEYAIVDFTNVTEFELGPKDLERIRARNVESARHLTRLLIAFVAPTDLMYGMSRMHETLMDIPGWQTHVFRNEEDARAWLTAALRPPAPTFRA